MAVFSTAVLGPPGLPRMNGGVELFINEYHHVFDSAASGDAAETNVRRATVLMSFGKSDAERAALTPLRHALTFGRFTADVCDGAEWLQKLSETLLERFPDTSQHSVAAAVSVGSDASVDAETVQAAVNALRNAVGTTLMAVLLVSTRTHQFASVLGISGFISSAAGREADCARAAFLCLSMMSAPESLNGRDILDLIPVLGSASHPSTLAFALWIREGNGGLIFPTPRDKVALESARNVVAVPLVEGELQWSELHRLHSAINSRRRVLAPAVVFAATGAVNACLTPSTCLNVPIFRLSE